MGFRNTLKYIPIALGVVLMSLGGYHFFISSADKSSNKIAVRDSILISQPYKDKIDSTLSRAESNYKSVISSIAGINKSIDSIHSDIGEIRKAFNAFNKRDSIHTSLDSVASSP